MAEAEIVVIIAGTTVPGRYLGGMPISLKEIRELAAQLQKPRVILSGPIIHCNLDFGDVDYIAREIPGLVAYYLLTGEDMEGKLPPEEIVDAWAPLGAEVTRKHPGYPNLVCELETFRGCPRGSHCSFCSERFKKVTYQRSIDGIIAEVEALAALENTCFRLERPGTTIQRNWCNRCLECTWHQRVARGKVLHSNKPTSPISGILQPALLHKPPRLRFGRICRSSCVAGKQYRADPEKTFRAIEIMNAGLAPEGIPKLPGLNFHGLRVAGTMELNLAFAGCGMRPVAAAVNIARSTLWGLQAKPTYSAYRFQQYKDAVNKEINKPMLQKVFPRGTLYRDVIIEESKGLTAYGRQPGSYPILVGIPGKFPLGSKLDVKIVDHGYRSITGLPWPLKIREATLEQLAALPGIGKNRARKIFLARDIDSIAKLQQLLPDADLRGLEEYISFA